MLTVIDGEDGVDSEDGEGSRRTENKKNIMESMGMTGTDGKSTANRLERNSRSELYPPLDRTLRSVRKTGGYKMRA